MTRSARHAIRALAALLVLSGAGAGCLPNMNDYWSSLNDASSDLDADADADTDADGDADSDGDTDECGDDDSGTCGDGGDTDTSTLVWDGSVDGGVFCGDPQYEIFLSGEGFVFDNSGAPYRGNPVNPDIVITGYSYFGCSHCETAAGILEVLFEDPDYADHVVYYFRHYPFGAPPTGGWSAHLAARAAQNQDLFWEMHDAIFAWDGLPAETDLPDIAAGIGAEPVLFAADYASQEVLDAVTADKDEGVAAGVTGTPSLFINGIKITPWVNVQAALDCLLGYSVYVPPDAGIDSGL